jgi:hypothetical protein
MGLVSLFLWSTVISKSEYFWCAYLYLVEGHWEERQRQFDREMMNFHGEAVMQMLERTSPIYDLMSRRPGKSITECIAYSSLPALLANRETHVERPSLGPWVYDAMVHWSRQPTDL